MVITKKRVRTIHLSYADILKININTNKQLPFSKDGLLIGQRLYGNYVINPNKYANPILIEPYNECINNYVITSNDEYVNTSNNNNCSIL